MTMSITSFVILGACAVFGVICFTALTLNYIQDWRHARERARQFREMRSLQGLEEEAEMERRQSLRMEELKLKEQAKVSEQFLKTLAHQYDETIKAMEVMEELEREDVQQQDRIV